MIVNKYYAKENKYLKLIEKIGQNSFNIFLFQILYFSFGISILDNIMFRFIDRDRDKYEILYLACFILDLIICYKGSYIFNYINDKIGNIKYQYH